MRQFNTDVVSAASITNFGNFDKSVSQDSQKELAKNSKAKQVNSTGKHQHEPKVSSLLVNN